MARNLTPKMINEEIQNHSAWGAFLRFVEEGSIMMDRAIRWMAEMFRGGFLAQVGEAKAEVQQLSATLSKLELICRAGTQARNELQMRAQVNALYRELQTFDRGITDLYETHLTMYGWIDPAQAQLRPTQMARAMETLRQRRLEKGLDFKDPSLFDGM